MSFLLQFGVGPGSCSLSSISASTWPRVSSPAAPFRSSRARGDNGHRDEENRTPLIDQTETLDPSRARKRSPFLSRAASPHRPSKTWEKRFVHIEEFAGPIGDREAALKRIEGRFEGVVRKGVPHPDLGVDKREDRMDEKIKEGGNRGNNTRGRAEGKARRSRGRKDRPNTKSDGVLQR
jgi:hypothetical protein